MNDKIKNILKDLFIIIKNTLLLFTCVFVIVTIISICIKLTKVNIIKENNNNIIETTKDSLIQDNNKTQGEINVLDSIKNIKINESKNLNNDSTLKLFYKLIGAV